MNILVTGGAGYIGSAVVERLDRDHRVGSVLVADSLSGSRTAFLFGGPRLAKTRFRETNILDTHEMASLLRGVDVVVHAAAVTRHTQFYFEDVVYEQVNRWGTAALCNLLREKESTVRRLIYLSTTSVYGKDAEVGSTPSPTDPYAISKFEGERYVESLAGGAGAGGSGVGGSGAVEPVILRLAQVFGYNPCVRTDTVVNSLILGALQSGQVHIYGQGGQRKVFAELAHVADRVVDAALGEWPSGRPVGLSAASGADILQYELSVRDVADLVERALGRTLDRIHVSRDINYGSLVSNQAAGPDEAAPAIAAAVAGFQEAFRL